MREIAHLDSTPRHQHGDSTIITKQASDELMLLKACNQSHREYRVDGKSIIGEAVMITGEVITEEDIIVQGQIDGIVYFKDCNLLVGNNAQIQANLFVKSLVNHGEIKGDVYANDYIEIKKPGHVFGDIHSPRVSIESGAVLMGKIEMEAQDIDKVYLEMSNNKNTTEMKTKYSKAHEYAEDNSFSEIPQTKDSQWPAF
jgi:cytoskeletal protein CcmA (bactofilin family)